ncbi:cell division control protein 42 homolog [Anneissia japonica]|uniref:cell division control protein 42 homolog n=1 Tax=Anneissia japonica TaxID=1529436 RepID=UPI001425B793|nr:cell division control protein 42 homolog [Anneissia japonica]
MQTKKCSIVGDGNVGKSCIMAAYKTNEFPSTNIPTVYENHELTVMNSGEEYNIKVYEAGGTEDYDRLRPMGYNQTDVFLVCFCVVKPRLVTNIETKWLPEITHYCPNTPYILLGTKIDLRDDPDAIEELRKRNQKATSVEEGETLAKKLKAVQYIECSAKTQEGVRNVFEEALLLALKPPKPPREPVKKCQLL